MDKDNLPVVSKSQLIAGLKQLGLSAGQVVMLRASAGSIGWVIGGPDIILEAVLEILGPRGTLMMMIGWEDVYYFPRGAAQTERDKLYLAEFPGFNAATSRANRGWGILTQYLATRRGVFRSGNPDKSVAAVGPKAQWLTSPHAFEYGYGPNSPFERFIEAGGKILLLGVSIYRMSLLHYAEHFAHPSRVNTVI